MTASPKAVAELAWSQPLAGVALAQSRAALNSPSRYDFRMLATVPESKAWLKLPFATSSVPSGATARPVGKKRRVGCCPLGPKGGGNRSAEEVLHAAVRAANRARRIFMQAAFLGPTGPGVKPFYLLAIGRNPPGVRTARARRAAGRDDCRAGPDRGPSPSRRRRSGPPPGAAPPGWHNRRGNPPLRPARWTRARGSAPGPPPVPARPAA